MCCGCIFINIKAGSLLVLQLSLTHENNLWVKSSPFPQISIDPQEASVLMIISPYDFCVLQKWAPFIITLSLYRMPISLVSCSSDFEPPQTYDLVPCSGFTQAPSTWSCCVRQAWVDITRWQAILYQLFVIHNVCSLAMADRISHSPTFSSGLCPSTMLCFLDCHCSLAIVFFSRPHLIIFTFFPHSFTKHVFFWVVTMCQALFGRLVSLVLLA